MINDPKEFSWPCTDDAPVNNGNGDYRDWDEIRIEPDEEIDEPDNEPPSQSIK